MKPLSTSVAPGPNGPSVIASLFQKMLLNSATGFEKSGRVVAFGYCATYAGALCQAGSFLSLVRPAPCGTPIAELSDVPVVTLFATVLLAMFMRDESSS